MSGVIPILFARTVQSFECRCPRLLRRPGGDGEMLYAGSQANGDKTAIAWKLSYEITGTEWCETQQDAIMKFVGGMSEHNLPKECLVVKRIAPYLDNTKFLEVSNDRLYAIRCSYRVMVKE